MASRSVLGDLTTGEAEQWQAGFAAGQRQGMTDIAALNATIVRLLAEVASLRAEAEAAPTGLEGRGA